VHLEISSNLGVKVLSFIIIPSQKIGLSINIKSSLVKCAHLLCLVLDHDFPLYIVDDAIGYKCYNVALETYQLIYVNLKGIISVCN
jgi:hypothetical protein